MWTLPCRDLITLFPFACFALPAAKMIAASGRPGSSDESTAKPLVYDLDGRQVEPLSFGDEKAKVFVFTQEDCPIANRYAPLITKMQKQYETQGIQFYLVYPDPDETGQIIRSHMKDYSYDCTAYRDPDHSLVDVAKVAVTPEAAVFLPDGTLAYSGRIDDQWADFGKPRVAPTSRDLENAIEAVLAGTPIETKRTKGVGCYISDLKR